MTSFWISIPLVFLKFVVFYTHGCLNWDIWVHLGRPWKHLLSFPERRLSSRLIITKQKSNNTVMHIISYSLCISKKITQETYHIVLPLCKCLECLFVCVNFLSICYFTDVIWNILLMLEMSSYFHSLALNCTYIQETE